jgi:hypothetical protein
LMEKLNVLFVLFRGDAGEVAAFVGWTFSRHRA